MNTPDVYAAWLTAGNNLQPVGAWLGNNWPNVAIAAGLLAFAVWSINRAISDDDTRPYDPRQAQLMTGHEQQDWDSSGDLDTCNAILAATNDQARKEEQS
ncbi:hypothetical protein [Streptomyces sp. NPDC050534]|uniref:hypothetical protein n=1 Tax=Streptomyces sp. NPDC050534 TaxID=3365625 RepID=UPI00379D622D